MGAVDCKTSGYDQRNEWNTIVSEESGKHINANRTSDSDEGKMHWIKASDLSNVNLVNDFDDLIEVMLSDGLTEFQYVIENDEWIVVKK